MNLTNKYVKFIRGSASAWELLKQSNGVSNDVLYFITTTEGDASRVDLYLGNQLIGGGEVGLAADAIDNSSIVLDSEGKLKLKNFKESYYAFDTEENQYIETEGFIAGLEPRVIATNDGGFEIAWYAPNTTEAEGMNNAITAIQGQLAGISGTVVNKIQSEINTAIAGLDHLSYITIDSIDKIQEKIDAQDADVTKYIYLVLDADGENDSYDEYMVIKTSIEVEGAEEPEVSYSIEKIGNLDINLGLYYTKDEAAGVFALKTDVADLQTLLGVSKDENNTITSSTIDTINSLQTSVGDLSSLLGYTPAGEGTEASLSALTRIEVIENTLGISEDESGVIVNTVGDLDTLLLNTQGYEGLEPAETLVDAINTLTEWMTWSDLDNA